MPTGPTGRSAFQLSPFLGMGGMNQPDGGGNGSNRGNTGNGSSADGENRS